MDYDGDGDLDVVSGSYTGEIWWFERLESGGFAQGVFVLAADGEPLKTGTSVVPELHDVDGDGDLDMVVGTRSDGVYVFENVGSRTAPSWSTEGRRLETVDGDAIKGSNAHFADWNGNGVLDLVLGSEWGRVVWHRNIGTNTAPRYAAEAELVARAGGARPSEKAGPERPGQRVKVHVTDWNGDGRMDLLVGDVQYMTRELPPLTTEEAAAKARLQPRLDAAEREMDAARAASREHRKASGEVPAEVVARTRAAKTAFHTLRREMAAFDRVQVVPHGFVWLYLRRGR